LSEAIAARLEPREIVLDQVKIDARRRRLDRVRRNVGGFDFTESFWPRESLRMPPPAADHHALGDKPHVSL
jgi:hypothetical protein